ncbi:PilZ domain-containing protein [Cellulomonas chengniuliangii]|uniref:PilZ domain-containing protein n=1 Tax=Cellulomonas chengniuliangii TaxID=2968084 RepID=A0ABY5L187_9CELL|nr:PilZ domain-containing protein [Cellulomonas chengniuliangii]MCC2307507.1 PilZ domain-containing protein [Cellulomonas chengniuliangii]MCC2318619.1 PilZ domain-containing protein [Cellulomonas chengniuliangii]UUI75720.1 PilZ domain-containing protein [Cellulomonas chengniuliangii]
MDEATMHELATCTINVDGGASVTGFVRVFDGDMMMIGVEAPLRALEPGSDVTVEVLDEVRGECLYAGYLSRVGPDGMDIADVALVSTLQKREVVRVSTHVACTGTALARWTDAEHGAPVTGPPAAASAPAVPTQSTGSAVEGVDGGEDEPVEASEPVEAEAHEGDLAFTMLDISAHGMRILSQATLQPGQRIRFLYEELPSPMLLEAVVVRAQPSRTGTHYGCRFLGLTSRQTDDLFRHVLQTQGVQRRERMRL